MNSKQSFYRTMWRWHFYAGLFCIPFIIILSVTGAIYLFKPQIDNMREKPFENIVKTEARKLPNEHIAAALAVLPNAKFHTYRLPENSQQGIKVSVFSNKVRYLVYVNPFNLQILDVVRYDALFLQWVKNIHGELLAGKVGEILVELAACWTIVLILTGLYLWWPRNARGLAGVLYPRLQLKGRSFWKDLHAVVGMWISILVLFLLISGLPWTFVWGSSFKEVRAMTTRITSQDWSTSQATQTQSWRVRAVSHYDLTQETVSSAANLNFAFPVMLSVSDSNDNTWKVSSMNQNRPLRKNAWIDGATGNVSNVTNFSDKKLVDKAIGIGIAAHEGQLFGWFNQVLGVLSALGLITLAVSGFVLWRKRKNSNSLGAPEKSMPPVGKKCFIPIVLLPVLLLPLLLISVLCIIFIEYAVIKKAPKLSQWLGF